MLCREPESLSQIEGTFDCNTRFFPDFAFALKPPVNDCKREGALLILRKDGETTATPKRFHKLLNRRLKGWKTFPIRAFRKGLKKTVIPFYTKRRFKKIKELTETIVSPATIKDVQTSDCNIYDVNREEQIYKTLYSIGQHKVIITDRMHALIFAIITKTPCVCLPNKIPHKLTGYKSFTNAQFITNIEDLPEAITKALEIEPLTPDFSRLFKGLKKQILAEPFKPKTKKQKYNQNCILTLIKNRRSIRKWTTEKVTIEQRVKILEAGRYAPTAVNLQCVTFRVIINKGLISRICQFSSSWFRHSFPSLIVVVLYDLERAAELGFDFQKHKFNKLRRSKNRFWSRFVWQDTSCSMMNMILEAESLGLKSCWASIQPKQISNAETELRALLNIPQKYALTSMLFLGHSNHNPDINKLKHHMRPVKRRIKI